MEKLNIKEFLDQDEKKDLLRLLTAGSVDDGKSTLIGRLLCITVLRVSLILLSSLLSACVTAFAGPISFVGIAVPHLIKSATGTAKPLVLIPGCFLGGAVVTLFCDGIARTLFAPTEVSISTVTAVFLVPVVIVMMLRRQEERG